MTKVVLTIVSVLTVVLLIAFAYHYYFVDTLLVSEAFGRSQNPAVSSLFVMLDFDTGLTRYDMYHLSQKSKEWKRRSEEIDKIEDTHVRLRESNELNSEIMKDTSVENITRKAVKFGATVTRSVVEIILSL